MNRNRPTCSFGGCGRERYIGSTKCNVHSGAQEYSQWMRDLVSGKQLSSTATTSAPLPVPDRSPWVHIPGTPQNSFRGYATRPGNSSSADPQAAQRQEDRTAGYLQQGYVNSYPHLSGLMGGPGLPVTRPLTDPGGRQSSVSGTRAVGLPERTQSQRQPQTTGQPGINLPAGQYRLTRQSGQYRVNQQSGQYDLNQGTGQYDVNRGTRQYGVNYGNTQPALNRPSCDYGVNWHIWHPTLNQPARQPGSAQSGTHPAMNEPTMTMQQRTEETIVNHLTRQLGINQAGMFNLPPLQHGMSQLLRMPTGQPSVGQPLSQQFMAESARRAGWNQPTRQAGICQPARQTGMILPTRLAGENQPEGQSGRSMPTLLPGNSQLISQSGQSQPARLPGMNQSTSQAVTSWSTGHDRPPDPRTQSSVQHDQSADVFDTSLQSLSGTSHNGPHDPRTQFLVQRDQSADVSDTSLQSLSGTSHKGPHDPRTQSSVQRDEPAAVSDTSLQSLTGTSLPPSSQCLPRPLEAPPPSPPSHSQVPLDEALRPPGILTSLLLSLPANLNAPSLLTRDSNSRHSHSGDMVTGDEDSGGYFVPAVTSPTGSNPSREDMGSLQRTPPYQGLCDSVTSSGPTQGVASSADQNRRSSHAPCVAESHSVERSVPTTTSKQLGHQQTVNAASDDSLSTLLSQSLEQGARHQHTVTEASDRDSLSTPLRRSQEPVSDPPGRLESADVDDIIFMGSENFPEQAMKQESDANEDAVIFMGSENLPVFPLLEQIMKDETDVTEDNDIVFQGVERRPRVNGAVEKKVVTYVLLSREEALDSELEEIQEDSSASAIGPSSDTTSSLNRVDSAHTVAAEQQETGTGVASSPDKQQSQPSAEVAPTASSPDKQQSQPSAEVAPTASSPDKQQSQPSAEVAPTASSTDKQQSQSSVEVAPFASSSDQQQSQRSAKGGSVALDNAEIDSDDDFIVLDFSDDDEESFGFGSQQSQEYSQETRGAESDTVHRLTTHQATCETECGSEHRLTTHQATSETECGSEHRLRTVQLQDTCSARKSVALEPARTEATAFDCAEKLSVTSTADPKIAGIEQPGLLTMSVREKKNVSKSAAVKSYNERSKEISLQDEASQGPDLPAEATPSAGEISILEVVSLSGQSNTLSGFSQPVSSSAEGSGVQEALELSGRANTSARASQPAEKPARRAREIRVLETVSPSGQPEMSCSSRQPAQNQAKRASKVRVPVTISLSESGQISIVKTVSLSEQSTQSAEAANEIEVVETVSLSEQPIQSAENATEAANEIEVVETVSLSEQPIQSAENAAEAANEIEVVETVSLSEQQIQSAENAAEAANDIRVVETVSLSEQSIQSEEATSEIRVVETVSLSETDVNEDDDIVFQGVKRRPRVKGAEEKKEVTYVLLSREEALDSELEEIQEDSSASATGPSSDTTSSLNRVDSAHTVAAEQQETGTGVASSPDKQQSQPSAEVAHTASSPDKQQSQPSAEVAPTASSTDKQQSQPSAEVALIASSTEQSTQSAENTAETTNEIEAVETVSLSEQSIQSAGNTTEAASEIIVLEPVSLSEQSIQSAENTTEAASEIIVLEPGSLSEQSIQSAENTTEAASEIIVLEPVSLSEQSIQSAENTTEAASEIVVLEPGSLSEQSIQSAENTTEAASETIVLEPGSLSEQSIQSAENTTEATSEIRVVETVSLSGQSCNWSTQPARAKLMNALSTEAYYRCGGFDGRCSFHTLMPTQLELHLREAHPRDEKYPCVHCGSQELGHDDLLQHLDGHLGLQSLALYCSHLDCDFSSFSPEEVITHMGVCHADYLYHICWRCCTKFGTLQEFSAHVKRNLVTIIRCPHCSAKDVNRKSVLSHIVTSHPDHGRMVGIQKALICQERKLNNWSGQIESGVANRDQGPPVLERIEPLPSSQGLPQGVVSAEGSSMLSSSQRDGELSSVCGVPGASTERKVCVIAPMTEIKAKSPPHGQAEQENVVAVKQEYEQTVFDEGISAARQKETDVPDSDRRTCETSSAGSYQRYGDSQTSTAQTSPKEPDSSRANLPRILGLGENLQQEDNGSDWFSVASNTHGNKDNASNMQGNKDNAFNKKGNKDNLTREGTEEQEDAAIAIIRPVSENFDIEDEAEDSAAAENEPDYQDETMSPSAQDLQPAGPDSVDTELKSLGTALDSVGTAPDSVGMRPETVGTTTRPETVCTSPETVGTRPESVGTRLDSVGTRPETVSTRPESFGTRPEIVGTRPETVGTRPETVSTRPETVGTRPETVGTRPETVGTRPETVGTSPETVSTRPESFGTRPETVSTRPESFGTRPEILGTRPETVVTEQPIKASSSTTQGEEEPAVGRRSPQCDAEAWINLTYSQQDLDDSVDALEILCRFCDHGSRTVADHVQHIHAIHPERFMGFACRVCDFVSADPELRSAHKCRRLRSRPAAGLTGEDLSPRGNKKTASAIASDRLPKLPSSSARTRVYVRSERSWVDGALRSCSSGVDGAEMSPQVIPSSCGVDRADTSPTEQCNAGETSAPSSSPATPMASSSATGRREESLPQRAVELDLPGLKSTLVKARPKFKVSGAASGSAVDDDGSRPKRTTAGLSSESNMAAVKVAKKQMLYCKLCRFSRRSVEKMCKHVYRTHKSVMKCPLCSVYPAGDNTFYRHLSDKHAEERDAILSQVSAFNWITELAAEVGESDCNKTQAEKAQLISSKDCKALASGDGIKPASADCDKGKPPKKQTKLASSKSKHYKGKPSQKGTKTASSKLCKGKALTTKMKPVPSKDKSRSLEYSAVYSCKLCSHSGRSPTWMRVHVYLQHMEVMKCPRCNAYPTNDRGFYHHLSVRHPAHKDALYKQHRSLAWLERVYPSTHDTGHQAKTSTSASQKRKHDGCENVSGEGETLAQPAAKKLKASETSQPATAKKIKASETSAESAAKKLKTSPTQTTSKNFKPSPALTVTPTPKRKASEILQQSAAKKLKTSTQKPAAEANKVFKMGVIHCKLCSKFGRSKAKLYLHLYTRHPEVQCSACSTQVSTASQLKKHLKEKHPEREKALFEQSKPANFLRFPDDLKSSKEKGTRWVLSKKVQNPMRMRIRKASTASTVSKLSDIDKGSGSLEAPTSAFDAVSNQVGTCFAQDSNPPEAEMFPSESNSPELESYNTEDFPSHGSELDSNTNNTAGPTERCLNNAQLASDSMPSEIGQFSSDCVAMDTAASDEQYSGDANIAFDLHPSERGMFLLVGTSVDTVQPEQQCTDNAPCALGSNLSEVAALSSDSVAMDPVTPKEPESNSQQLQSSASGLRSSAVEGAKDAVVSTPSADGVVVKLETRVLEEEMEYRCPHCTSNHKTRRKFYEHLCYHYHYRCYQCAHCSFLAFCESSVVNHSKKTHSTAPEVHHHIKQRLENRIHLVSEKALVPVSAPYTEKRLLALERAKQKKLLKQNERQQQKAQKLLNKVQKKDKSSPRKISLKKTKKPAASTSSKKKKKFSEISSSGERKWLMCPYCRGERKTQTAIEGEIRYHIHYKPFCCPYCEVTSGSEKFIIENHIPKTHPGEPVTVRFEGIEKKEERLKELLARAVALSQSTVKAEVSGNVKMKYRKGGDSGNVKMKYRKGRDSGNVKMKYRKGRDSGNVKMKYQKGRDSGNVKMKYQKGGDSANVKMKYRKGEDSGEGSDVHRCTHCDSFWFRGNKQGKVKIQEKMGRHVQKMHKVCCSRCPFRTTDREALSSHVLASHPTVNAEDAQQSSDRTETRYTSYPEDAQQSSDGLETRHTSYPEDAQQSSDNSSNIFHSSPTSVDARLITVEPETRNTAARYSECEIGNTDARYSESETGNTDARNSESETRNTNARYSESESNPSASNSEAGAWATLSHDTGAKVASFPQAELMPANFLFDDPPACSSSDPERVVDEACGSPQHGRDAFHADVPASVEADDLLFCEELPPDHPQSSNR